MKIIYTAMLLCLSATVALAQGSMQSPPCYTDQLWAKMVQQDSTLIAKRHQMDELLSQMNGTGQGTSIASRSSSPSIVVPTVIYVVSDDPTSNISMAQIQSQMDQLNENFAPYGFSFCYAQKNASSGQAFSHDPGDSAGVFRFTSNALSNVDINTTDAQLKALSNLPSADYLRIFVVHTITPQGVLGYALLPGGSAALDGIVVRSDVFGSSHYCSSCQLYPNYNIGASLTHEVGHYLGLYHTFQGGCSAGSGFPACVTQGDWVCDTPPTTGSFGCPGPAPLSCNGVDHELIENYMDYTHDPCKNSFTTGQKDRMIMTAQTFRSTLISTANLINTGVTCISLGDEYAHFDCANFNGCKDSAMTFSSLSSVGFTYSWSFGDGGTAVGPTASHTFTAPGQYVASLTGINTTANINATYSATVFITACTALTCSTNKLDFEYGYLDFSSGSPIAVNHPNISVGTGLALFADFFAVSYRGDNAGHPLFHITPRGTGYVSSPWQGLVDSSYHLVDSLGLNDGTHCLAPLPQHPNMFCYVQALSNALKYSIIDAANGPVHISPGKKLLSVPSSPTGPYLMAFIPNCDGNTMWLITNLKDSIFRVYKLDSSGTLAYHGIYGLPAAFKSFAMVVSPDGRTIEASGRIGSVMSAVVLHFDKASGNITNSYTLYTASFPNTTSYTEWVGTFSPNSRFFYQAGPCCAQNSGVTNYMYQFDMYSPDPNATRRVIFSYPMTSLTTPGVSCFTGPDQKIYIGRVRQPNTGADAYRLSVINYPDLLENGLNSTGYNQNGPSIRPPNCPYYGINYAGFDGVADRVDAMSCAWQPDVPSPFGYMATGCLSYQFRSDDCSSASWDFGDPNSGSNTSTSNTPVHTFSAPGTYTVHMVAGGHTFVDSIHIAGPDVHIASTAINPCPAPYATYSLSAVQPFVNYIWTVTHGTPATASGRSDLTVNWNPADTIGTIMVIGIDTVMGCSDTSYTQVHYHISGTASVNYTSASICNGHSYPFGTRLLTTAGTYRDTMMLSGGCMIITELALTVTPGPAVSWTGGTVILSPGAANVPLNGGIPTGGVYSGAGVTGNTFYPASASTGSHTITYTYTDANGCIGTAQRTFVITAIDELDIEARIQLYPNPATHRLVAQSDLFTSGTVQVLLYDMTGRSIAAPIQRSMDKAVFDISALSDGVYSIRFTVNGQEASKRFVKME
ncbi:MAG: hypothetical protein JWO03_1967 [Bacteroidetes bacterium]|nr:hypothetical protein [Bacteroidota bacterium]